MALGYKQQHPSAGPWQLHLRSEQYNILLSHRWLRTMFWEFCMELQNGAVVGIMGPVKNRSWRVSSQPSPSLGHQLLSAFYLHPLSSFSLNPSNQGFSLSAFLYFMLIFYMSTISLLLRFIFCIPFLTLIGLSNTCSLRSSPFPKLIASNECLEEPHSAPGPLCCDARGKYLTNHPLNSS